MALGRDGERGRGAGGDRESVGRELQPSRAGTGALAGVEIAVIRWECTVQSRRERGRAGGVTLYAQKVVFCSF